MKMPPWAWGAALAASSLSALSAETVRTDPVLVTATRLSDDVTKLPSPITILTAEEIQKSPAKTLPELLALTPGIDKRSYYGNFAARDSVDMRGFGATATSNTLILLNGRRLNDIDMSAIDFSAIPRESIERIEIIHGGGGVLYGDGAVGGTINIVTREDGQRGTTGSVAAGYGAYKTTSEEASVTYNGNRFGVGARVQGIQTDGYRDHNRLEQGNGQLDFRFRHAGGEWYLNVLGDNQELDLPGERRVRPAQGIDELHDDPRGSRRPNDYSEQKGRSLVTGYTFYFGATSELVLDGGFRQKNQRAFFDDYDFGGSFTNYVDSELATGSFTPRYKIRRNLWGGRGHSIVGMDGYDSAYDSDRSLNKASADSPIHRLDVDQTRLSYYGQSTAEFDTATALTAGARQQRVKTTARDQYNPNAPGGAFGSEAATQFTDDGEGTYEFGVRQGVGKAWSLFTKFGRSVRFATVDEFFQTNSNNFLQEFSVLKPQTARTFDLGFDFASQGYTVNLATYVMSLKNEIHFNPTLFTNVNLDPTKRSGVNLSAGQRFGHWQLKEGYAYTVAEFDEGTFAENEIPLIPKHTATFSLGWDITKRETLTFIHRYVGEKRFDNDQNNTFEKIPAYDVLDLKVIGRYGPVVIETAINNLLNEKSTFDYGIKGSTPGAYNAYPLPERNYSLSARANF
jgi:iron complex outermembrane receptor protein